MKTPCSNFCGIENTKGKIDEMVEWKVTVKSDFFFENKLLLQSDVVFNFESNGRNFSSLAPFGVEKKIIFNFYL